MTAEMPKASATVSKTYVAPTLVQQTKLAVIAASAVKGSNTNGTNGSNQGFTLVGKDGRPDLTDISPE